MKKYIGVGLIACISVLNSFAEDGHQLWLRFAATKVAAMPLTKVAGDTSLLAVKEYRRAISAITGRLPEVSSQLENKTLLFATSGNKTIARLGLSTSLKQSGPEGYIIKTVQLDGKQLTVIASESDKGLLYGAFHLLRLIQTGKANEELNISEKPSYNVRVLNHWDNLDGTVERGYAGHSIWKWDELPGKVSPRYTEYARANASIGINGSVLNNVNASPEMLSTANLQKVKAIAGALRPYNIKVYLSINFSSPAKLGGLPDSDPLKPAVRKWWKDKADEIYKLIPDFGGFLVKANSEGLPGPQDYGRTHADGANMLADALKPHKGIVMWRAFVYSPGKDERAKLAYKEFQPLDGKFRDNVIIQVKNGPIDFQPREAFSPLFGAMKKTPLMPEWQITQEYLGFSNHLVFLASLWQEFLQSDTYCKGKGSTIAKVTDGTLFKQPVTAIAGVANIGEDANWCGYTFAQANWYAFGRMAWNNNLTASDIADEWIKMTFTGDAAFVNPVKEIMTTSHETVVSYMMPLGLHHIFAWEHHYGPEPWCEVPGAREDWLPRYYHKADSIGLGFDRTTQGSDAVSQYYSPLKEEFNSLSTCPEKYLLWFHHVPWDYKMKSGNTLWKELCYKYDSGVKKVRHYQAVWDQMEQYVDHERFSKIQSKLRIQSRDAVWWKDACLLYFQQFSKRPIPYDIERPVHDLDELMKIKLNLKHHN